MSNRLVYAVVICLIFVSVILGLFLQWRSQQPSHAIPSGTYRSGGVTVTDDPYGLLPTNPPPQPQDNECTIDPRRCESVKSYYSKSLGVSFQVYASAEIIEEGNTIYVDGKQGQYMQVLQKYPDESLYHVVERVDGPLDKCTVNVQVGAPPYPDNSVESASRHYPDSYSMVTVLPNLEDWDRASSSPAKPPLCNAKFVELGAARYYLMDSQHPTMYVRLSLGQDSVPAGRDTNWQNTIRFK